ncbi:MAG: YceI family protein [Pseudomonadota bacterium]
MRPARQTMLPRALAAAALFLAVHAVPAGAAPVAYLLQPDLSVVAFETDFGTSGLTITGRMPIAAASLAIDFANLADSRVEVTMDAARARTSNPLATGAMLGPRVLAVATYPTLRFESTAIRARGAGAEVAGNLTIRDVTRPVTLAARIYRQTGTEAGDLSRLSVLLTGKIDRSDFGAGGFPNMVGSEVRLKILARIEKK